jgi:hypothetical protein
MGNDQPRPEPVKVSSDEPTEQLAEEPAEEVDEVVVFLALKAETRRWQNLAVEHISKLNQMAGTLTYVTQKHDQLIKDYRSLEANFKHIHDQLQTARKDNKDIGTSNQLNQEATAKLHKENHLLKDKLRSVKEQVKAFKV